MHHRILSVSIFPNDLILITTKMPFCLFDHRWYRQARRDGLAVQPLFTPKPGPTGYYQRELLIRTPGGRRVDLVTITDCHGITVRVDSLALTQQ